MWIKSTSFVAGLVAVVAVGAWQYAERTRVIEGTWLYMFEGSDFFEQSLVGQKCELYDDARGWLNYGIRQVYPSYDAEERSFPSTGIYRSEHGQWRMEAFEVRFKGRKRFTPWGSGHMGMSKSEYDVDRMLSVRPIPGLNCYIR